MSQKIICVPRVAALFARWQATFPTRALTFEPGKSAAVADSIRASRASFLPSVVMARALSTRGSTFSLLQPLVAGDQLLLEGLLLVGHRAGDDNGFAGFQLRRGQIEHLGGLHVGKRPPHLLEFR